MVNGERKGLEPDGDDDDDFCGCWYSVYILWYLV